MGKSISILIAQYWPEFNDGRIQRMQGLYQYLHRYDCNVKILSLGTEEDLSSQTNIKFFSRALKAEKQFAKRLQLAEKNKSILNFVKAILKFAGYPDRYIFDILLNYRKIKTALKGDSCTIISSPVFSTLVCSKMAKQKVIIDLRDLFVGNPTFKRINFLDRLYFYYCLKQADEVWVTTREAKAQLDKFENVVVVRNGLSEEKLAVLNSVKQNLINYSSSDEIILCYFGNLGGKRQFENEFTKLASLLGVQLKLFGELATEFTDSLGSIYFGRLEWKEMCKEMLNADVLVACISDDEHAQYAIPGKIYDYIATGKPILLLAPRNSASEQYLAEINYLHIRLDPCETISPAKLLELSNLRELKPVIVAREEEFSRSRVINQLLNY